MYNPSVKPSTRLVDASPKRQVGSSLVELLVGIAIGLMVITAAIGTLVLSRSTAVGINDQLELQQQANMAMRIISTYVRQSASREVIVDAGQTFFSAPLTFPPAGTSSIQAFARTGAAPGDDDFGIVFADIGAVAAPFIAESTVDCLGNPAAGVAGGAVTSRFYVANGSLMCQGLAAAPQALITNVQRFRVLYLVSNGSGIATTARYFPMAALPALGIPLNNGIVGAEICLELASNPRPGFSPPPGNYTDCDGNQLALDTRTRAVVRQTIRLRAVPVL